MFITRAAVLTRRAGFCAAWTPEALHTHCERSIFILFTCNVGGYCRWAVSNELPLTVFTVLPWRSCRTLAPSCHVVTRGTGAVAWMNAARSKASLWTVWCHTNSTGWLGLGLSEASACPQLAWPTLITVLAMTTRRTLSLAFSSHVIAGHSWWTGALLLTAGSVRPWAAFYTQRRTERLEKLWLYVTTHVAALLPVILLNLCEFSFKLLKWWQVFACS